MGLSAISLPDTRVNLYDLAKKDGYILSTSWDQAIPKPDGKDDGMQADTGSAQTIINDIKDLDWVVDGVSFMKAAITHIEQQRKQTAVQVGRFTSEQGKHTYVKFPWGGEDLIIDNTNVCHCDLDTPAIAIYTKLAIKMGWLRKISSNPVFWTVRCILPDYLQLSMSCSWRFTNLNVAFRSVVGEPTRSLHVYSDVAGSSIVGYRVTELLREVKYKREGRGTIYVEPLHIQYIPLRNEMIEIVQTQVAETNGDLVKFGEGNTIVTLHFKKT